MPTLSLVMPMAGRGSRFARAGHTLPKPLVDLFGRPFYWWATESVRQAAPVDEIVFVLLREHCESFGIDARIRADYPDAKLVVLDDVTEGAAETARLGIEALESDGPIAINDCDHAFACPDLGDLATALSTDTQAALITFRSDSPNFSYARLGPDGAVTGTVEKQVVSPFAIAGCYLFQSPAAFHDAYAVFRRTCPYDELFLSGVIDQIAQTGDRVGLSELAHHFPFGTPEELARLDADRLRAALPWSAPDPQDPSND